LKTALLQICQAKAISISEER